MAYLQCRAIWIQPHMFLLEIHFKSGVDAKTECVIFAFYSMKFVDCSRARMR